MAHRNEEYIYELTKNLDWNIKIHRCSDYADGVVFVELIYDGQKHVMVMNADQAEKIAFALHHASIKLRDEK